MIVRTPVEYNRGIAGSQFIFTVYNIECSDVLVGSRWYTENTWVIASSWAAVVSYYLGKLGSF